LKKYLRASTEEREEGGAGVLLYEKEAEGLLVRKIELDP